MTPSRTRFYLDKQNAKWKGVCAGIADYTGVNVMWIRFGFIAMTLAGGNPIPVIAYILAAWLADKKPIGLYDDAKDAQFWQGVRQSPSRSSRDVRAKFRELDRRLADIETYYTSGNKVLANEIDALR